MTDSTENTLNAAQQLGESYRKLGELFLEQNRLLGEIRERADSLTKTYVQATNDTYNEVVADRLAQWERNCTEIKALYDGYAVDYPETMESYQTNWQKWLEQAADTFKAPETFTSMQTDRLKKIYDDFYATFQPSRGSDTGWTYDYAYPFTGAQSQNADVKQAA